jgi:hypothetical protein
VRRRLQQRWDPRPGLDASCDSGLVNPSPDDTGTAAGTVDAAWLEIVDELLHSVNHALANRLAALVSLVRVLEYGDSGSQPLLAVLQQEVERMERSAALLRLLPRERGAPSEPVRLADVLPDALELHRLRSDMRDRELGVQALGDLPPAWSEPVRLTHALLAVLDAAVRSADPDSEFRARCEEAGDEVTVRIEFRAGGPEQVPAPAAGPLSERAGGRLESGRDEGGRAWLELRLPTLAAARRAEDVG